MDGIRTSECKLIVYPGLHLFIPDDSKQTALQTPTCLTAHAFYLLK